MIYNSRLLVLIRLFLNMSSFLVFHIVQRRAKRQIPPANSNYLIITCLKHCSLSKWYTWVRTIFSHFLRIFHAFLNNWHDQKWLSKSSSTSLHHLRTSVDTIPLCLRKLKVGIIFWPHCHKKIFDSRGDFCFQIVSQR